MIMVPQNLLLLLFVSGLVVLDVQGQSLTQAKALYDYLFTTKAYNKALIPKTDQSQKMTIYLSFFLSSIIDFDEQEESLSISGYLRMHWNDDDLVWNSTNYGGINVLYIPQDDIWKPDMSLRNSYVTFKGFGATYYNTWITNDGLVFWEPFQVLKSTCSVDIRYFPFDTQTCSLKFLAWSYSTSQVEVVSESSELPVNINYADYSANAMWKLMSSSVSNGTSDGSVTITMKLKRKPLFYVANVLLPIIMLSVLSIANFALPITSGERASFGITVFLSLAVFLTIVASELPKNSDKLSQLAIYILLMTAMSTAITLFGIAMLRIGKRGDTVKIGIVYRKIHRLVQTIRCRKGNPCKRDTTAEVAPTINEKGQIGSQNEENEEELTWIQVVNSLDFAVFWIATMFTFLATVIYFINAIYNPQGVVDQYSRYS